jgi:hypothetical protein
MHYNKSVDFQLGGDAAQERGPVGPARALVRDGGSALTINYDNDFKGGVNVNASGGFRVRGNTQIDGSLCLGPAENNWCFTPNANKQWLDIRRNGAVGDKPDTAEYHLTQDGNLFLQRSTQQGWVADNIRNPKVDNISFNGSPWNLRQEGGQYLVARSSTNPDHRYAMASGNYVDIQNINNKIDNGQAITLRSDKKDKEQRRLQRDNDEVARFSNNNRGDWEKLFIEKL